MVNPGVPDEVQMEKMLQIETCGLPFPPQFDVQTIEFAEHVTLVPELPDVAGYQIARALRNLKPHLHPHGSFGQRSHEGFEQPLEAIPSLIACVIRLNASDLIRRSSDPSICTATSSSKSRMRNCSHNGGALTDCSYRSTVSGMPNPPTAGIPE